MWFFILSGLVVLIFISHQIITRKVEPWLYTKSATYMINTGNTSLPVLLMVMSIKFIHTIIQCHNIALAAYLLLLIYGR